MKEDPLSNQQGGKAKRGIVIFNKINSPIKFVKIVQEKLILFNKKIQLGFFGGATKLYRNLRKIDFIYLKLVVNQFCDQVLEFKYFQHVGIAIVFILVLINTFMQNPDQLGNIDYSFESAANAKALTNSDLVNIVKTLDEYTYINEKAESLPEKLDEERKIVVDKRGFLIQPALAMTADNLVDQTQNSIDSNSSPTRKGNLEYTIQSGDSLGKIASDYDLKISTLKIANNLSNVDTIIPGKKLIIPAADGIIHQVKAGETLLGVVNLYKGNFNKTLAENQIDTNGTIYIGQKILVVDGEYIPPKPALSPANSKNKRLSANDYSGPRGNFIFPTSRGTFYNGYHAWAIDIPRSIGTAVYASDGGRVVIAGWNNGGYGRYCVINHGNGFTTLYGHLSALNVEVGQYVGQGQVIGAVGSTGRSTGPHLHFEIILNGKKLNPISFFR